MRKTTLLIVLFALALSAAAAERPPNMVVILADDLGWRDLGCQGSTWFRTPNIDRLASDGARLTRFYSASPVCSPTRASILTGCWPWRFGLTMADGHAPEERLAAAPMTKAEPWQRSLGVKWATRLPLEAVTDAELLAKAGYATAHFGKWHLGRKPFNAEAQGFALDLPRGYSGGGPAGGFLAPWKYAPDALQQGAQGENIEARMASEAERFIAAHAARPFLLHYWAFSVHTPLDADPQRLAAWRARPAPPSGQRSPMMGAMVEELDLAVGRILLALEKAGVADNTIVVFTSDNGPALYVKTADGIPVSDPDPLRGGKATIWEAGIRVPFLCRWPGVVRPGTVSNHLASSVDILPTLLTAAGVPAPPGIDGVDLRPLLARGEQVRDRIHVHYPHDIAMVGHRAGAAVIQGDLKLIRTFNGTDAGHLEVLHDLATDPGESVDLAASRPDDVRRLGALLDADLAAAKAVLPQRNPSFDPTAKMPARQK